MSTSDYSDVPTLCVGSLLGAIQSSGFLRSCALFIKGTADTIKTKTDNYTGLEYHIYGGMFFGRRKLDPQTYVSNKLVLPWAGDVLLLRHYEQTYAPLRFRMLLETFASDHSTGFDWTVKFKKD